jgi:p-cumate 2,3-dioxygenase subunit alpha
MTSALSMPVALVDIDRRNRRFRINRDAYRSQSVFEREKEIIFSKCWLYIGHASEIPNKGDFVSRTVAGRDLIFMHGRSGDIGAYYNSCTHRGTVVCRTRKGNTKSFSCPYHGWVFNTEGKLISLNADEGFPENINADGKLDLPKVARLDHYRGFYFINFNPKAIDLSDFLAGATNCIDAMIEQSETGELTVLPGEHVYSINANYKYLCENSYDGYHLLPVHISYLEFLDDQAKGEGEMSAVQFIAKEYKTKGRGVGLGNGHANLESWVPSGRPVASALPSWSAELKAEVAAKREQVQKRVGKERADYITDVQKNMVIFPNLVLNDNAGMIVRFIEPIAPNRMQVNSWALGPADESPTLRAIRLDTFVSFLGPAGFGSADDVEMLELCQRGIDHTAVEWNELSRGMTDVDDLRKEVCKPDAEGHMRAYWAQWDLMMRGIETLEKK